MSHHTEDRQSTQEPSADAENADAAETALAALRRDHLIRSWIARDHGSVYEIVVGRGTVAVPSVDATGALWLAETLRRNKVTVVAGGYPMGHRTMRYDLSDGRFADRNDSRIDRTFDEYPYTVYLPGGDPSGCAAASFAAHTLKEALALAAVARVYGLCVRCRNPRPLHVRDWRPDPTIPCTGCGAAASTAVTLQCASCQEPIQLNAHPGTGLSRSAWSHSATGVAYCAPSPTDQGHRHDHAQARPQ